MGNGRSASADSPKMLKNHKKHPKIGCFYLFIVNLLRYNVNFEQFRLTFAMKCTYSHTFFNIF